MNFVWIILVGTAAMAATLMLVKGWERRRVRLMKEAGVALGLRPFDKGELLSVPSVEIMRKRGRTIGAALEGSWRGDLVMVFDHSYPAGKNISRTTVFMLRLPRPALPEFAAIRKNINLYTPTVDLPKIAESPASLKWHWLLYAPNAQWPFGAEFTEWLCRNRNWSVEGRGSGLFLYQRAKRAPTKNLEAWLNEAHAEAKETLQRISHPVIAAAADDGDPIAGQRRVYTFNASFRI